MTKYAKVNDYSWVDDTWLTPYCGWAFEIVKLSKNYVWFLMDSGFGNMTEHKYGRKYFEILNKKP